MKMGIYALNPQSFPISQDLGSKSVFFQTSDLSAWFYNTNYSPWHLFRLLICQKTSEFQFSSSWKIQRTVREATTPQPSVYSFIGQQRIQWCRPGFVFPDYVRSTYKRVSHRVVYSNTGEPTQDTKCKNSSSSWFPQSRIIEWSLLSGWKDWQE